jgi:NAD(P)-dependent dehydrogenase (short-subunit alcohol dehydrogenase family)
MQNSSLQTGRILITGGTSGLGLGLVMHFLKKGYEVVATGRQSIAEIEKMDRFTFYITDFSNLRQTSDAVKRICRDHNFDIVINNAGVLSPPGFLLTDDGHEYSFQVNFLSHLLLNEIIIRNIDQGRPLKIAATVSPVYRIADTDLVLHMSEAYYRPFRAYSNSKLYLALMCSNLPEKHKSVDLKCIGFDPGVFSSGIFRLQKRWFRFLYRVAAPFMRNPEKIAARYAELVERKDLVNGAVYKSGRQAGSVPVTDNLAVDAFWQECYRMIEPYLK